MKFICEFVGGSLAGEIPLEVAEAMTSKRSLNWSAERAQGDCVPRKELDERPEFFGYCGPMWGGTRENGTVGVLRYETWEIYERMSL